MRGHDHIVSLRLSGFKPAGVYLWDTPVQIHGPQWSEDFRFMDVCTAGDSIEAMDLRFVVGVPVTVFGDDVKRVRDIAGACRKAGSVRVVASAGDKYAMWWKGEKEWLSF